MKVWDRLKKGLPPATLLLVVIMTGIAVTVAAVAILVLYLTALKEDRARLMVTAQSQARLIEAVARHDQRFWQPDIKAAIEATLSQIRDAHSRYAGFGVTGEFTLARCNRDRIEFLLSHRHDGVYDPKAVPRSSGLAQPMQRALAGESGTMIGLDYRGARVLAAYEPIQMLEMGIVAKIDLVEIQAPFLFAAYIVLAITAVLVVAGTALFARIANPIVHKLRESEERFQLAASGSGTGVIDWPDVTRNDCWLSEDFYRLLGYRPGEFPPSMESLWAMVHPEDVQAVHSALQAHLEQDESFDVEPRVRDRSGAYRWFRLSGRARRDRAGRPERMTGIAHEVTARKHAELALIEKERSVSTLIDNLPGVAYRCANDRDYSMYFLSDRIQELSGYPSEAFVSGKVSFGRSLVHLEDQEQVWSEIQTAVGEDRPYVLEYRIVTADGSEKWLWEQGRPVLAAPEAEAEIVLEGYLTDITSQKNARQELLRLNRFLRTVLECNQVLVRAEEEVELAESVCRIIVEQGGYRMAWVGYPEVDAEQTIAHLASFGATGVDLDRVQACREKDALGRGPASTAMRTGQPVVVDDMETDPDDYSRCLSARELGCRSGVSVPLMHAGKTLGVLTINAAPPDAFRQSDVRLLSELADDLAFGIAALRGLEQERLARQALQESEKRLRTIIGHEADAVLVVDGGGLIRFANPAAETLFGRSRDALVGTLFAVLVSDEGGAGTEVRRPDGSGSFVELRSIAIEWEGRPAEVVSLPDVTERHRTERELRRFSHAVEQSPASVIITDLDGNISYVNETFVRVTGYDSEEAVGQNPRFLKSGRTPSAEHTRLWKTITAGGTWRGEFCNKKKNGDLFWESATISPIYSADGKIINYVGIKEDITELKGTQRQLQQAQKMEAVGQLTGGIAHDFNNLLGVVLGNLQLAERSLGDLPGGAGDGIARRLRAAVDAVLRGADLTRRLLAFSRRQVLQPQVIDVNELVQGMLEMLDRALGETIEVQVSRGEQLWSVSLDPGQTENALLNLALNARDAMPEGGRLTIETLNVELDEVYTRCHQYVNPGEYVLLAVSDTGAGMSPEVQAHAFEPFFTTKEDGKGTGLGLSMVYGFVKQSNGHVNIYSEPGTGTMVKLYFPRVQGEANSLRNPTDEGGAPGGNETLLLVEDDAALRETTAAFLERLGYRVLEADSGPAALDVMEAEPDVALLFTDVVMPGGMNGAEVARRARERQPELRVLFTSGYSRNALSLEILSQLEGEVIGKPYLADVLARRVRQLLDEAPRGGDTELR